jgi:glycosyltransferase involved in cell wall biosynthesis
LIRQSPFSKDIHNLGFVPTSELPSWYRAAEVFVFPSLYEGFGLPPVEAMACECPVLSSTKGALADTVGEAAGKLEPDDVNQMCEQLTRVAGDFGWRERLRESGLLRAREFDWAKTATMTLEVYAQANKRWKQAYTG